MNHAAAERAANRVINELKGHIDQTKTQEIKTLKDTIGKGFADTNRKFQTITEDIKEIKKVVSKVSIK